MVYRQTGSDTLTRRLSSSEIADDLAERIRTGEYGSDTQLVFSELMKLYDTTRPTIKRAILLLRDRKLVVYYDGRGNFVASPPGETET